MVGAFLCENLGDTFSLVVVAIFFLALAIVLAIQAYMFTAMRYLLCECIGDE